MAKARAILAAVPRIKPRNAPSPARLAAGKIIPAIPDSTSITAKDYNTYSICASFLKKFRETFPLQSTGLDSL
ncbi:hypothetical protein Pcar_3178 [Syntrophotalea carbinolica DSM 2380]|uniref:Uncharacterized protein n=1 Tax=Syntrophotalea carbinolica (strain DSM 2380 / NBRC 103641 / GraBd1) TaxID=338963 RepID=Q0C6Y9_SYNC1|nr:hypothetical protein Pcar_3178 [Syntrophotalea carbinolica DSM 2380]